MRGFQYTVTRVTQRLAGVARIAVLAASLLWPTAAFAMPMTNLVLSEVFVNPNGLFAGDDDGAEWIEIFNGTGAAIDLSTYSIGYGGPDYTWGTHALSGIIAPDQYWVVGGPTSNAANGNPVYDEVFNFAPDLPNAAFWVADGIALFDNAISTTVPIDVVIYSWPGGTNSNNLIDETGNPGAIDVFHFGSSVSYEYDGINWVIQNTPTPNTGGLVATPEPGPGICVLLGLAILAAVRRHELAGTAPA